MNKQHQIEQSLCSNIIYTNAGMWLFAQVITIKESWSTWEIIQRVTLYKTLHIVTLMATLTPSHPPKKVAKSWYFEYLVNKPISAAAISEGNAQGWKIVQNINSWQRSEVSRETVKFKASFSRRYYPLIYPARWKGVHLFYNPPIKFLKANALEPKIGRKLYPVVA